MARIRTIKPEFFTHEGLFDLEQETGLPIRVAFAGMWTVCDREGRFDWRPRTLKAEVLPHDNVDFSRVLDALATRGFLVKYASGSEVYGYIPSWKQHQFVNGREAKSTIPKPPENHFDACLTRGARVPDASPTGDPVNVEQLTGNTVENQQVDACSTREARVPHASVTHVVKERKGREGNDASDSELKSGTPSGLNAEQYALHAIEELNLVWDRTIADVSAQSIAILAKIEGMGLAEAHDALVARAKADAKGGVAINRFWFTDRKFLLSGAATNRKSQPSVAERMKAMAAECAQ